MISAVDLPTELTELIGLFADERPELADGAHARTRCYQASAAFAGLCELRDLRAQPWPAWADDLLPCRGETPWPQDSSHCVCAVWLADSRIITVDFTAAQYGLAAFPLVREVAELPAKNPWLLSAEQAAQAMAELRAAFGEHGR